MIRPNRFANPKTVVLYLVLEMFFCYNLYMFWYGRHVPQGSGSSKSVRGRYRK